VGIRAAIGFDLENAAPNPTPGPLSGTICPGCEQYLSLQRFDELAAHPGRWLDCETLGCDWQQTSRRAMIHHERWQIISRASTKTIGRAS
jgi:hypothetical protein